ncbi:MAG: FAD-dependent monooxygenase [Mangrovicoccus sp.]
MAFSTEYDIIIAGGGLAGLTAALTFARSDFSVLCLDPAPPVTERNAEGADHRSTAILQPGQALLQEIGVWDRLAEEARGLRIMRIVDAGGAENTPREIRDFDSTELGEQPFGWNLANWFLRRELAAAARDCPGLIYETGLSLQDALPRSSTIEAQLSDGRRVTAKLVIGADGRNSRVRDILGITVKTRRYGQKALAFAVNHPTPHDNISTEIHRTGGPFTLVPLSDYQGQPCSAVVWMAPGRQIAELAALSDAEFSQAATERSCNLLGPLELASARTVWPIIAQSAQRFVGPRMALMAEAAHVVPPIGAQGLNMSLGDLICLRDLAVKNRDTLGAPGMLQAYDRARRPEVQARLTGIDLLNRASMTELQPLRDLRHMGLRLLHGAKPVRLGMMRLGLGARN